MLLIYYKIDEDEFEIYHSRDYYRKQVGQTNVFGWLLVGIFTFDPLENRFKSIRSGSIYMFLLETRYWNTRLKTFK